MRDLSARDGNLCHAETFGTEFTKVESRSVCPDQVLLATVVSNRNIARYFRRREWARLQVDEYREEEKSETGASDCPRFPSWPGGFGNCIQTPVAQRHGRMCHARRGRAYCHCGSAGVHVSLQPLQVGAHLRRTLRAQIPVLLQRLVNDPFQFERHLRLQAHDRRRGCIQYGFEYFCGTAPAKRERACGHLVEHSSERE